MIHNLPKLTRRLTILAAALTPLISSAQPKDYIEIKSSAAILHLGSLDSFDVTPSGKEAAENILKFLEKGDRKAAQDALAIYRRIVPDENFGGEYTALEWVLECELAPAKERKAKFLSDPFVAGFHALLAKDNWTRFREFLRSKYHIEELPGAAKDIQLQRRVRFMEDFILFANPKREAWERTSKMIAAVKLQPGEIVADIGSGPGYFSFRFANLVGPSGKVFAIDTNRDHLDYLREYIAKNRVTNVTPVQPEIPGLGVPEKVDVVYMCSLYHNIYAVSSDEEREGIMAGVRDAMKPGARLVLVDNGPVTGTLPYHGPYISRDLIIQQFRYLGFDHIGTDQFIPQRYMLTFRLRADAPSGLSKVPPPPPLPIPPQGLIATNLKDLPPTPGVSELVDGDPFRIRVLSGRSLLRTLVSRTSPIYSNAGRRAAETMLAALRTMDPEKLRAARDTYVVLTPKERIGDEYSALQWFCEYALTPPAERAKLVTSETLADYVNFFAGDDFKTLKLYLKTKYLLEDLKPKFDEFISRELVKDRVVTGASAKAVSATGNINKGGGLTGSDADSDEVDPPLPPYDELPIEVEVPTLIAWWEHLAFMNPRRGEWERTEEMLRFLDVKPGQRIADVGSGAGFYTFKFAELVGKEGKVYALDMLQEQLDNVVRAGRRAGFQNIEAVKSKENDCTLPENSIDTAYLCSLYHASYVTSMEYVRDQFVASMKKALKPGGRLVIVDNQPMSDKAGGYYGPRIAKELVIAQLTHYGFRFSQYAQMVPQRYVLVFTLDKPAK